MGNTCVCEVQIVCLCRILSSKCVNLLNIRNNAVALTERTNSKGSLVHVAEFLLKTYRTGNLEIGIAIYLSGTEEFLAENIYRGALAELVININDMTEFVKEPLVNLCYLVNLINAVYLSLHCLCNDEDTLICWSVESLLDIRNLKFLVLNESVHTLSDHTETLLDSFLEVTTDSHNLTYGLHRRTEFLIYATELREVPAWNLTNHIVKGRLEECACCLCY